MDYRWSLTGMYCRISMTFISIVMLSYTATANPVDESKYPKTIKLACVGDSITAGGNGADYPGELAKLLGNKWEVKNFGVGGHTLLKNGEKSYWNTHEYTDALAYQPDVVIILFGINDANPGTRKNKPADITAKFEEDCREMIKQFRELPSKPVIYLGQTTPPNPSAPKGKVQLWNQRVEQQVLPILKKVAGENCLEVIDFRTPFSGKPEVYVDNWHHNAGGAKLIAEAAYKSLTGRNP